MKVSEQFAEIRVEQVQPEGLMPVVETAASEERRPLATWRRMAGAAAVIGTTLTPLALAPGAEAATHAATRHMSARDVYKTCQEMTIVTHKGTNSDGGGKKGPDVDTKQWIAQSIAHGNPWIELDGQLSSDGEEFLYHDNYLGAGSNGTGKLHSRDSGYLSRVRTVHGQPIGRGSDLVEMLQAHPRVHFQHEFKNYDYQWHSADLERWYRTFKDAGVMGRVTVSSGWPNVLEWFEIHHPEVYTEYIGFTDHQPNLKLAEKYGIDQVNLTYVAAFKRYGKYATYLAAAEAKGVNVGVRSKPSGRGDNAKTWAREIRGGADALVTQGRTKSQVCKAVKKVR